MSFLQIPKNWNRIEVGTGRYTPGVFRTGDIITPAIAHTPGLPLEFSGLMPNRDHNGDLFAAFERIPHCLSGEAPVISIFAADPFLRVDKFADLLAAMGYWHLTNLPSVAQYGHEFGEVLDDLDVGAAREYRTLTEFRDRGFNISLTITSVRQFAAVRDLKPRQIFVVPDYDQWLERSLDPDQLLRSCAEIAECRTRHSPEAPIVLFVGRQPISLTQARDAGADGVLVD